MQLCPKCGEPIGPVSVCTACGWRKIDLSTTDPVTGLTVGEASLLLKCAGVIGGFLKSMVPDNIALSDCLDWAVGMLVDTKSENEAVIRLRESFLSILLTGDRSTGPIFGLAMIVKIPDQTPIVAMGRLIIEPYEFPQAQSLLRDPGLMYALFPAEVECQECSNEPDGKTCSICGGTKKHRALFVDKHVAELAELFMLSNGRPRPTA